MTQEMLRDATAKEEIDGVLTDITDKHEVLLAWQNQDNGRVVENVYFKEFDHHNGLINVGNSDKNKELSFKEDSEVFFRSDARKMLFRAQVSIISKKLIEAKVPSSIKLPDRRSIQRETYKVSHEESSGMAVFFSIFSQVDQSTKEFECELFDLSNQGAGIRARQKIMKHFKEGDILKLKSIKGKELEEPVEAKIVYIKEIEEQKKMHHSIFYRIGTAFTKEVFVLSGN